MRTLLLGTGLLLALCGLAGAAFVGPYYFRVMHVAVAPASGFHSDFYLYVSPGARAAAAAGRPVTLLVQPNNSGTNSDDPAVHRKDAWWTGFERSGVANDLDVILLVPAFPRPALDWHIYSHALDRDTMTTKRPDLARLDLQLLAMVDHARATLAGQGVGSDPRFLLQGFSASGMFANRFAILHPSRLKAVAVGSPGGWPIAPLASAAGERLPYPAGVADLEQLSGKPFDAQTYAAIPQLFVMGAEDDNDSLDFRDGWDEKAAAQVDRLFGADPQARWNHAQRLYVEAGANARFQRVQGIGHDRKRLQEHSTRFLAQTLAAERRD